MIMTFQNFNALLVLDGFEGAPYKRVHKVQLFGGVPYMPAQPNWHRHLTQDQAFGGSTPLAGTILKGGQINYE